MPLWKFKRTDHSIFQTIAMAYVHFAFFVLPFLFYVIHDFIDFENAKLLFVSISNCFLVFLCLVENLFNYKNQQEISTKINLSTIIFVLFLVSSLISLSVAENRQIALWGAISMPATSIYSFFTLFIFASLVLNYIDSSKKIISLLKTLIVGGVLLAILAFYQHFGINLFAKYDQPFADTRAIGTIGQPVAFGAYIGVMTLISLGFFIFSKNYQLINGFFSFLLLTAAFFSNSRAPVYALVIIFFAAIIYFIVFQKKKINTNQFIKCFLVFLMFCLNQYYVYLRDDSMLNKKSSAAQIGLGFNVRMEYWKTGWEIFKNNPIIGVGSENFQIHYEKYSPLSHNYFETWKNAINNAHNEPIQIATTQGIVGLSIYLLLHFFLIHIALSKRWREKFLKSLICKIALFSFFYLALTNLFAFNLLNTQLFFFLLPLLIFQELGLVLSVFVKHSQRIIFLIVLLFLVIHSSFNFFQVHASNMLAKVSSVASSNGDYPLAMELNDRAIEMNPLNYGLYCFKAMLIMDSYRILQSQKISYQDKKEFFLAEAESQLESCKLYGNNSFLVFDLLTRYYQRYFSFKLDYLDKGIQTLTQGIKAYPKNPVGFVNLAILYKEKKDFQKADELINYALFLKKDYFAALIERFALNYEMNKGSDNVKFLENLSNDIPEFIGRVDFQESANSLIHGLLLEANTRSDEKSKQKIIEIAALINSFLRPN